MFNFVAEPFYLLYANYIMSVSIEKITIDKMAMLVMVGAVVAFVVRISNCPKFTELNNNWSGEHGFCRNYNWSCISIDVNNCV